MTVRPEPNGSRSSRCSEATLPARSTATKCEVPGSSASAPRRVTARRPAACRRRRAAMRAVGRDQRASGRRDRRRRSARRPAPRRNRGRRDRPRGRHKRAASIRRSGARRPGLSGPSAREVEPLELLEDREDRGRARRGRAHAADPVAAIGAADRRRAPWPGRWRGRPRSSAPGCAARRATVRDQRLRRPGRCRKRPGRARRCCSSKCGELGLRTIVPTGLGSPSALVEVARGPRRVSRGESRGWTSIAAQARRDREAVAGEPDRGLEQPRPRQPAVALVGQLHQPDIAGHADAHARRAPPRRSGSGLPSGAEETGGRRRRPARSRGRHRSRAGRSADRDRRGSRRRRCPSFAARPRSAPASSRSPRRRRCRPARRISRPASAARGSAARDHAARRVAAAGRRSRRCAGAGGAQAPSRSGGARAAA